MRSTRRQIIQSSKLIELSAYSDAIVETVRQPLLVLDKNLYVESANQSFFNTFKMTRKEVYGSYLYKLNGGEWNISSLKKLLENILPKSSHFEGYEVFHNFSRLGPKTMLLNARRLMLQGNKTQLILLAIEDITDRKELEQLKNDFISFAAHELKTPIAVIKIYTEIAARMFVKDGSEEGVRYLNALSTQAEKLTTLINELLNVSVIEARKLSIKKSLFDLDSLIENIVTDIQLTTDTHKIIKTGKVAKKVYADEVRIQEVLINLLTNAIKYSPKAKKIIITISSDKSSVTVCVQDFGMGFSKQKQEMVFERYFRLNMKEEKNTLGFGLGLYISAQIIKEHNGKIWARSQKGKGSTFCFKLPLR